MVVQVLDGKSMIVGIKDGGRDFPVWVFVKYKTEGLTDGLFFRNDWRKIVGGNKIKVTGTKTLKLAGGGTRTMFVVEPFTERAKKPVAVKEKPVKGPNRFVGKWRIIDDKGVTSSFFTLTDSFEAKKSHAPKVTAKWEIVGDEARITWSDGWKDTFGRKSAVAFSRLHSDPEPVGTIRRPTRNVQ